jgi:hypothetical protein
MKISKLGLSYLLGQAIFHRHWRRDLPNGVPLHGKVEQSRCQLQAQHLIEYLDNLGYEIHMKQEKEDPRKTGLKNGLRQLTPNQLRKVINYKKEMVLDEYNYQDGKFCPLAVALDLDKMEEPTHEKVYDKLINMGYKVYNTRGIEGEYYTTHRLDDLLLAAKEVLDEKVANNE